MRASASFPRFTKAAIAANRSVVELLEGVGKTYGAQPGQIALAWLLAKSPFIVPIPGTTKLDPMDEKLRALSFTLSRSDMWAIDNGFARLKTEGKRPPDALLASHDDGANVGTSSQGGHRRSPLPRNKAR